MAESNYIESLRILRDRVHELDKIMNDPFKAPELSIEAIPAVQAAMWDAQVEFAAMTRRG